MQPNIWDPYSLYDECSLGLYEVHHIYSFLKRYYYKTQTLITLSHCQISPKPV